MLVLNLREIRFLCLYFVPFIFCRKVEKMDTYFYSNTYAAKKLKLIRVTKTYYGLIQVNWQKMMYEGPPPKRINQFSP